MPSADHDQFAEDPPGHADRRPNESPSFVRRRAAVLGVTGFATVLGVAVFVITARPTHHSDGRHVGAISVPPAPAATRTRPDPEVSREIVAARSRAAADGVPVHRALISKALGAGAAVKVSTSGSPQSPGGTFKVVSARTDLTGYQELAWAGDEGTMIGPVHCTQDFRLSNDVAPTRRPTLLMCWRTSAERSVYTVALSLRTPPSRTVSVAAIEKAWGRLS